MNTQRFSALKIAAAAAILAVRFSPAASAAVAGSLVFNEGNTVSGSKFLDQDRAAGPRNRADLTLGRLQGNGQNWLELLIAQGDDLGGGQFANTLDVRGWKLDWAYDKHDPLDPNRYGSGTIEFTNDPLWAAVPKGTLLTISEWKQAWYHNAGTDPGGYGGLQRDGGINGLGTQKGDAYVMGTHTLKDFSTNVAWNPLSTATSDGVSAGQTGDWRLHVWAGERNPDASYKYFNFTGSVVNGDPLNPAPIGTEIGGLYALNNDNWQWTIKQPVPGNPDNIIQGPNGESLPNNGGRSIGADEVFRLENFAIGRNPAATQADYLGVINADYQDGTTSTYGQPNAWSGSSITQDLASLRNWIRTGDDTLDGVVDGADLLRWQRGTGTPSPASLTDGDLDGDGSVNGADLALWKSNFGVPATAVGAAVPEPAGGFALVLILFAARRRQ